MRTLWQRLPGPAPVRAVAVIAIVVVLLIGLFFLFERAGDLLDSGGVVGPAS